MARRKKRKTNTTNVIAQRDPTLIANHPLLRSPRPLLLTELEDRRAYHPEQQHRPALNLLGRPHRLVVADVKHRTGSRRTPTRVVQKQTRGILTFADAPGVVTCIRRKQRREVLHAFKLTGRGARSRTRRRNWRSDVSCR